MRDSRIPCMCSFGKSTYRKDKLKRYHEKYNIPSNCLYLKVPMMDSEIYHDVKLQKQKNIVKASTAVVETLNTLIGIKSNENCLKL